LGVGHRTATGGEAGVGEVAATVDGGADVRLAGTVSAAEQGSGAKRGVVGGVRQVGHDPPDVESPGTQRDGGRVSLSHGRLIRPYGTVTYSLALASSSSN